MLSYAGGAYAVPGEFIFVTDGASGTHISLPATLLPGDEAIVSGPIIYSAAGIDVVEETVALRRVDPQQRRIELALSGLPASRIAAARYRQVIPTSRSAAAHPG